MTASAVRARTTPVPIRIPAVASLALLANLRSFIAQGNGPLAALAAVLLALLIWMLVEGAVAARRTLRTLRASASSK